MSGNANAILHKRGLKDGGTPLLRYFLASSAVPLVEYGASAGVSAGVSVVSGRMR